LKLPEAGPTRNGLWILDCSLQRAIDRTRFAVKIYRDVEIFAHGPGCIFHSVIYKTTGYDDFLQVYK
jgi:hypothetical protein